MFKKSFLLMCLAFTVVSSNLTFDEDDLITENSDFFGNSKALRALSVGRKDRAKMSDEELDSEVTLTAAGNGPTSVTVLTHCMGGHFYDWSKNQAYSWSDGAISTDGNEFTYDLSYNPNSIISLIKKEVDGKVCSDYTNLDIVVASYGFNYNGNGERVYTQDFKRVVDITRNNKGFSGRTLFEEEGTERIYGDNDIVYCYYNFENSNGKVTLVEDESKRTSYITNADRHLLVIYDSINPRQSLDLEYRDYKRVLDSVAYDVREATGNIPKMNLIGYSNGGLLVTKYATEHQYNVAALKTIGTPFNGTAFMSFLENFVKSNYDFIKGFVSKLAPDMDLDELIKETLDSDVYESIVDQDRIDEMQEAWNYMVNYDCYDHHIDATAYGSVLTGDYLSTLLSICADLFFGGIDPSISIDNALASYHSGDEEPLLKYFVNKFYNKINKSSAADYNIFGVRNDKLYDINNDGFHYSPSSFYYDKLNETYDEMESEGTKAAIGDAALEVLFVYGFFDLISLFEDDNKCATTKGALDLINSDDFDLKSIFEKCRRFLSDYTKKVINDDLYSPALENTSIPGYNLYVLYGDVCVDLDSQLATFYEGFERKYRFYTSEDLTACRDSYYYVQDTGMPPVPHNLEPYDQLILKDIVTNLTYQRGVSVMTDDGYFEEIDFNKVGYYKISPNINNYPYTKKFKVKQSGYYTIQTLGNADTSISLIESDGISVEKKISPADDNLNKGYNLKNEMIKVFLKPNCLYKLDVWTNQTKAQEVGILITRTQDSYNTFNDLPFASINISTSYNTYLTKFIPQVSGLVTFEPTVSDGLDANIELIDPYTSHTIGTYQKAIINGKHVNIYNLTKNTTYLIVAWKQNVDTPSIKININYKNNFSNKEPTLLTFPENTYRTFSDTIPQNGIVDHYFKVDSYGYKYFIATSNIDIKMQLFKKDATGEFVYLNKNGDDVDNAFNGEALSYCLDPNSTYLLRIVAYDEKLSGTVNTLILPVETGYWDTNELKTLSKGFVYKTANNVSAGVFTPLEEIDGSKTNVTFDTSKSTLNNAYVNVFDTKTGNVLTPTSSKCVNGKDVKTYSLINGEKYLVYWNGPSCDGSHLDLKISCASPYEDTALYSYFTKQIEVAENNPYEQYITFKEAGYKTIQTVASDKELDTVLTVYDNNGNFVAADDNNGCGSSNSFVCFEAQAGKKYFLRVSACEGTSGECTLVVSGAKNQLESYSSISNMTTINGTITLRSGLETSTSIGILRVLPGDKFTFNKIIYIPTASFIESIEMNLYFINTKTGEVLNEEEFDKFQNTTAISNSRLSKPRPISLTTTEFIVIVRTFVKEIRSPSITNPKDYGFTNPGKTILNP